MESIKAKLVLVGAIPTPIASTSKRQRIISLCKRSGVKQGSDPLGPTQGGELNETDHVYGEIVAETDPDEGDLLPLITELYQSAVTMSD